MQFKTFLGIFFLSFAPLLLLSEEHVIFRDKPYFSYSDKDLKDLSSRPISKQLLTIESFAKWDPVIYQLSDKINRLDGQANRLMAYLYTAQRDFALLSYQTSHQWVGDPTQMIAKIIHLFGSDFQSSQSSEDSYSQKLSELVFRKIEERYLLEESKLKEYPSPEGPNHWHETPPFIGRRIGTCMPWLLTSLKDFQASFPPGPNSIIWVYGIEQIKNDQAHLTAEQRKLIRYWAGELGPESGNWFAIANQELGKKQLQIPDFLFIRAVFAMSFTDAMIAAFDSKYTYWVMRPHMRDPKLEKIIPIPKHPSYPSAHSVTSSTSAVILSHFFPDEKQNWQNLAIQAGNTRIWGGLHYVYDHEQGLIQGEKIGNAVIKKIAPQAAE